MADPVKIYLDEDVSVLVGEMLRARGIDMLTTRDAGNLGVSDEEQLIYAMTSGRVFLTHNRVDFERLAVRLFEEQTAYPDTTIAHAGIIIAVRRPPQDLTVRVLLALRDLNASDMTDQIRYI